jgi:hypothetical protein
MLRLAVAAGVDADSAGEGEAVGVGAIGTDRSTGVFEQIGLVVEVYCAGEACGRRGTFGREIGSFLQELSSRKEFWGHCVMQVKFEST